MRIILLTFLFGVSITGFSQVYKFRVFQSGATEPTSREVVWNDVDFLLVINWTKQKIQLYTSIEQEYDIIKAENETVNDEDDTISSYTVIDSEGKKCKIGLIIYKITNDMHVGTLSIKYSNVELIYRFKKT